MAGINNSNEPNTAPQADRWYDLTLGSSFKDHNSSKFCTFRYEFKPASIDKNQHGTLHKSKDNKVTVEFQNIQHGKPKMSFEGTSEDCKDNDAVLFFDGESFRLERLHRAVKRLRHNRMQGESTGSMAASAGLSDASPPPTGKGIKNQPSHKDTYHALPLEVERIDIGDFRSSDEKPRNEKTIRSPPPQLTSSNPSPDLKNYDQEDEEQLDIMNDDDVEVDIDIDDGNTGTIEVKEIDFDINVPHQTDDIDDDDFADVLDSDNDGPSAAEALKAQVGAKQVINTQEDEEEDGGSSSSSSSSGSSSGSSSSSSSDSESSEDGESSKKKESSDGEGESAGELSI